MKYVSSAEFWWGTPLSLKEMSFIARNLIKATLDLVL
jgi:hypothetical protein